jgi:hypothetical protein
MKRSTTTSIVSVRGSERNSRDCYNMKDKNDAKCVTIKVMSSTVNQPETKTNMPASTIGPKNPMKNKQPPPPPKGLCTIIHLASQLECQIQHHSGYVPQGAVSIAFFQQFHRLLPSPASAGKQEYQSIWKIFRRHDKHKNKKYQSVISVRCMDETEW